MKYHSKKVKSSIFLPYLKSRQGSSEIGFVPASPEATPRQVGFVLPGPESAVFCYGGNSGTEDCAD
jgi:hypothetical protein